MTAFPRTLAALHDTGDWPGLLAACLRELDPLINARYREARFHFAQSFAELHAFLDAGQYEIALHRCEELHRLSDRPELFLGRTERPSPREQAFLSAVLAQLAELSDTLLYGPVEDHEVDDACHALTEAWERFVRASSGCLHQPPSDADR